jgi:hypothetical protein
MNRGLFRTFDTQGHSRNRLAIVLVAALSHCFFAVAAHAKDRPAASDGSNPCHVAWMPKSVPDICEWETGQSLPNARTYLGAVAIRGKIYVAGGLQWNTSTQKLVYYNDILVDDINEHGKLGQWKTVGTFKNGRSGLGVVATKDCMVIAGGSWSDSAAAVYGDDVQTAHIIDGGELTEFVESSNRLRTHRSNHTLLAYEGPKGTYLYAVAGVTQLASDTVHLDTVEYAPMDSQCNVGPWSMAHFDIKGGRSTPQAVLAGNTLYVIGGWGDLDLVDIYGDVQYTTVTDDGGLSPWGTSPNRLPSGIYGHTALVLPASTGHDVMLLVTGGQQSTGVYSDALSYSYLTPGQLPSHSNGLWAMLYRTLPGERAGHAAVYWNGFVYIMGGSKSGGVYLNDVVFAKIIPGTP